MTPEMIAALMFQGIVQGGRLLELYHKAKAGIVVTKEDVAAALDRVDDSIDAYAAAVAANAAAAENPPADRPDPE